MKKWRLGIGTGIIVGVVLLGQNLLTPSYRVISVIDGDTIQVQKTGLFIKPENIKIRYLGVDTPETENQECFAQEAEKLNKELVLGQKVGLELDKNELDQYGRTLAYVYLSAQKISINERLLAAGVGKFFLDPVNTKYQTQLIAATKLAHDQKKGLWEKCAPDPEIGCEIKGNLDSSDKRWYHLPEFRHYDQTTIRLDKGDRWFCTEAEAIGAGFEKARE